MLRHRKLIRAVDDAASVPPLREKRPRDEEEDESEERVVRAKSVDELRTIVFFPEYLRVKESIVNEIVAGDGEMKKDRIKILTDDILKACFRLKETSVVGRGKGPLKKSMTVGDKAPVVVIDDETETESDDDDGSNAQCTKLCKNLNEVYVLDMEPSNLIIALYDNSDVIGLVRAVSSFDIVNESFDDVWYIQLICAYTDHFKGVGTYLLSLTETIAIDNGAKKMTLSAVQSAVGFYLSKGYTFMFKDPSNPALELGGSSMIGVARKKSNDRFKFQLIVHDTEDVRTPLERSPIPTERLGVRLSRSFKDESEMVGAFESEMTIGKEPTEGQKVQAWIVARNEDGRTIAYAKIYSRTNDKSLTDAEMKLIKTPFTASMTEEMRKRRTEAIEIVERRRNSNFSFGIYFSFSNKFVVMEPFGAILIEACKLFKLNRKRFGGLEVNVRGLSDGNLFEMIDLYGFGMADSNTRGLYAMGKEIEPIMKSELDSMKEEVRGGLLLRPR